MVEELSDTEEMARILPRRIDGPHSVGSPLLEPARVAELVSVGSRGGVAQDSALDPGQETESDPFLGLPESALAQSSEDLETLATALAIREEQLDCQTAQLGEQLQKQFREIEYREAHLNARAAELDNEFRRARLWTQEKFAEIREREENLAASEAALAGRQGEPPADQRTSHEVPGLADERQELESRGAELSRRAETQARREDELNERESILITREEELASKEAHLRERRQVIEREAVALHHARQEWERSHEHEQAEIAKERQAIRQELEASLQQREQSLAASEKMVTEHSQELNRDRAALSEERADWQRQREADREAIARQRSKAEAELAQRRSRLSSREVALDDQQGALDQLRSEITTAHRQSIEMRLMAEQLWAQTQGRIPPAEITQSIAQLRLKLAEQYRLEQQGLEQQKTELLGLAEKVAEQSAALRGQRQELQAWFGSREEEIERHAEILVSRERELLEQSEHLRETESLWTSERRGLEGELREAHSRLRLSAPAA